MDFGFIFSSAAGELFSPTTAAYALAALGLAVHFGYSGLLNFGQAGFMAVGAYGFAISTLTLPGAVLRRPAHRRRLPRRSSPCSWASRPCGCGPTTWPS